MDLQILNIDRKPEDTSKLFFGDTSNILRTDQIIYQKIDQIFKMMFSKVWAYTAISFDSDIIGWGNIDSIGHRIFLFNNGYQTVMDSGVVSIYNYLALIASNSELATAYQYVAQNESIHANSYSYGLTQLFKSQATEKLNIVYEDEFIKNRMKTEIDHTNEFIQYVIRDGKTDRNAKKLLLKVLIDTIVIENVKFPFSFFTTFSLNVAYDNAIQGFSLLLKMIARDELEGHVPLNKEVLRILKKDPEFKQIWEELSEYYIPELLHDVEIQEKNWPDYLLKDGSFAGFNREINDNFIEYRIDDTLSKFGLEKKYNREKDDTILWFDKYRKIDNQNASLQEVSNNNYERNTLKADLDVVDMDSIFEI